jgi:hypothetical protein
LTVKDIDLGINASYPAIFASSNQNTVQNAIDKTSGNQPNLLTSWIASGGPSFIYSQFNCSLGIQQMKINFIANNGTAQLSYRFTRHADLANAVDMTRICGPTGDCTWVTSPMDILPNGGLCFAFIYVYYHLLNASSMAKIRLIPCKQIRRVNGVFQNFKIYLLPVEQ